ICYVPKGQTRVGPQAVLSVSSVAIRATIEHMNTLDQPSTSAPAHASRYAISLHSQQRPTKIAHTMVAHQTSAHIVAPFSGFRNGSKLYIYDTEHEVQNRLGMFENEADVHDRPDPEVARLLLNMLDEHNKLVAAFRFAKERLDEEGDQKYPLLFPYGDRGYHLGIKYADVGEGDVAGRKYHVMNYQDAMAICRVYGPPDLFVTFTCNPKWKEIVDALRFELETEACAIDAFICAEIPDVAIDPLGYALVDEFMIHGPCGDYNRWCPCMKNDICSKKFPKTYQDETVIDAFGYTLYRRRNNCRDARHLTYCDFPKEWSWDVSTRCWRRRRLTSAKIGCMYYVHPTAGELYYLCMLLMLVSGATSFVDVRTFQDTVYETFREACEARGLLEGDNEWNLLFDEAIVSASLFQLWQLFVTIVVHCPVCNVRALFDKYWIYFSDDIHRGLREALGNPCYTAPHEQLLTLLSRKLADMFANSGANIADYDLPILSACGDEVFGNRLINDELRSEPLLLCAHAAAAVSQLNADQRFIFEKLADLRCPARRAYFSYVGMVGRERTDLEQFSKWVLDIGDGALPTMTRGDESEPTWVTIPEDLLIRTDGDAAAALISEVYPDLLERYMDPTYLATRAIVCPNNLTTDKINDYIVSMLPGHGVQCLSCDTISKASECIADFDMLYPTEFLYSINAANFPCHKLVLKRGVTVMLLRNLNQTAGLCNGTRMLVTEIGHRILKCVVLMPSGVGEEVFISRIALNTTDVKWPFTLQRRQFPVRICYAMTINKSQGQTLSTVGLYLDRPVFTHGQLYVAVSRVTSRSGLRILIENPDGSCGSQTRNVVYREVLRAIDADPLLWEFLDPQDDSRLLHTDLVLLDEEGNSIHAQVYPPLCQQFSALLDEGGVYNLKYFLVRKANRFYKSVENCNMISFTKWTTVEVVLQIPPAFPVCTYNLTPIEQLQPRVDYKEYFT
ncbi:hypothetical protein ACJX0J_041843, partial [Zea mays]